MKISTIVLLSALSLWDNNNADAALVDRSKQKRKTVSSGNGGAGDAIPKQNIKATSYKEMFANHHQHQHHHHHTSTTTKTTTISQQQHNEHEASGSRPFVSSSSPIEKKQRMLSLFPDHNPQAKRQSVRTLFASSSNTQHRQGSSFQYETPQSDHEVHHIGSTSTSTTGSSSIHRPESSSSSSSSSTTTTNSHHGSSSVSVNEVHASSSSSSSNQSSGVEVHATTTATSTSSKHHGGGGGGITKVAKKESTSSSTPPTTTTTSSGTVVHVEGPKKSVETVVESTTTSNTEQQQQQVSEEGGAAAAAAAAAGAGVVQEAPSEPAGGKTAVATEDDIAGFSASDAASDLDAFVQSHPAASSSSSSTTKEETSSYATTVAGFPASEVASDMEDYAQQQQQHPYSGGETSTTAGKEETAATSSYTKVAGFPASDAAADMEEYAEQHPYSGEATAKEGSSYTEVAGFPASEAASDIDEYVQQHPAASDVKDGSTVASTSDTFTAQQEQEHGGIRTFGVYVPEPAAKIEAGVQHLIEPGSAEKMDPTTATETAENLQKVFGGENPHLPQGDPDPQALETAEDMQRVFGGTNKHLPQGDPDPQDVETAEDMQRVFGGVNPHLPQEEPDPQVAVQTAEDMQRVFGGTNPHLPQAEFDPQDVATAEDMRRVFGGKNPHLPQADPTPKEIETAENMERVFGTNEHLDSLPSSVRDQPVTASKEATAYSKEISGFSGSETAASVQSFVKAQQDGSQPQADQDNTKEEDAPQGLSSDKGIQSFEAFKDDTFYEWWEHPFCDADELQVNMWLETDEWSDTEAAILVYNHENGDIEFIGTGDIEANVLYNEQGCLEYDSCYEFYFIDTFGDGFTSGGFYMDAGGINVLDIRPESTGNYDYVEYWGVYFGGDCEQYYDDMFGDLDSINDDVLLAIISHFVEPAPKNIDDTADTCDIGNDTILIEMNLVLDEYSKFDNAVALHDVDAPDFMWFSLPGAFNDDAGTEYNWLTCVDATKCNEFVFYDAFGNGNFTDPGKMSLWVAGDLVVLLEAEETSNARSDKSAEETEFSVFIGNCDDDVVHQPIEGGSDDGEKGDDGKESEDGEDGNNSGESPEEGGDENGGSTHTDTHIHAVGVEEDSN